MTDRIYKPKVREVWGRDIEKAERLVLQGPYDERYKVELDPEDFLDLCAGTWHEWEGK